MESIKRPATGTNRCSGEGGMCLNTAIIHVAIDINEEDNFDCLLLCADHLHEIPAVIDSHLVGSDCDMPNPTWYSEGCSL